MKLSSVALAALRDANRSNLSIQIGKRHEKVAHADHELITKIATAMMDKRAELIAEPLARCWYRLAIVAISAIDDSTNDRTHEEQAKVVSGHQ